MIGINLVKHVSKWTLRFLFLNLAIFSSFSSIRSLLYEFSLVIRVEHARYYCGFYCHAKVRAYARCEAIQQSVGHNRPDSRPGTKYANLADVGAGLTKTINANDCMCSYIDGFIKISIRTRAWVERDEKGSRDGPKRKEKTPHGARVEVQYYLAAVWNRPLHSVRIDY